MAGADWTDERIAALRRMWNEEGLSAGQIAVKLNCGVSRSAVLGKVHRLGLQERKSLVRQQPPARKPSGWHIQQKARVEKRKVIHNSAPSTQEMRLEAERGFNELMARLDAGPVNGGVTFEDLELSACRWPFGDPRTPEFRYCGCRKLDGLPYCEAHARVAFRGDVDPALLVKAFRMGGDHLDSMPSVAVSGGVSAVAGSGSGGSSQDGASSLSDVLEGADV